ncbi:MAG: L-rhamnose mutarotase [Chloroflexi bacterium]|nr:L-rhamnose mutarotase [Chloroflexota bacterium]
MIRIGRIAHLKAGCEREYEQWHQAVWPGVLRAIGGAGIRNYTIFRFGTSLFSYYEVDDPEAASAVLSSSPECQRWQTLMGSLMEAEDELAPWTTAEEVFHVD